MVYINKQDSRIIPFSFEYHNPKTIEETFGLLDKYGEKARLLAGGTDLLVKMKQRLEEPRHLINLKKIRNLDEIEEREDHVHIGALTRLRSIERSRIIKNKLPILQAAVCGIGSVQIRNMGTIGGNICNASPSADASLALLALDALVELAGSDGCRKLPIEDFFVGPGKTALGKREIMIGILIPSQAENEGCAFIKVGRTHLDLATVSIATVLSLRGNIIDSCRIAIGAAAPKSIRAKSSESFLKGKEPSDENFEHAAEMVSKTIKPITDVRSTAEYRRLASKGLTKEALSKAAEAARRSEI